MKENDKKTPLTDEKLLLAEFQGLLFEKIVPLKDLYDYKGNPMQSIIAYWRRMELLPFVAEGKWMEISFAQLIWLRILDDLRTITFPLPKMQAVCDYFFKDAYYNELPKKTLLHNRSQIKMKIAAGTADEDDIVFLEKVENILKYPKALQLMNFDVNYLSNLITTAVATGNEGLIYILFDGSVYEFLGDQYAGHRKNDMDRTAPHVCLSITHYLQELISNNEISTLFIPQLLNEDEQKVLREMRRKNVKQITITMDNDLKPRIEVTKSGVLSNQQTDEIRRILGFKNYEKIILDTIDEKRISFKRTRKKI